MGPGAFNSVKHYSITASAGAAVSTTITEGFNNIRIVNAAASVIFWRFNRGTAIEAVADTTCPAMLAGSVEVFRLDPGATTVSIIMIGGGVDHTVYFDLGYGI